MIVFQLFVSALNSMQGTTTLYCGMAHDIMGPLLLFPSIRKIFVICLFDKCCSSKGTWKSQKSDIKKVLTSGKRRYNECGDDVTHYLKGKSVILEETNDVTQKRWYLKFLYDGLERELIYFHHRNFLEVWPEEIQEVESLICTGAFSISTLYCNESVVMRKMIIERCLPVFAFYGEKWNFRHYCGHPYDGYVKIKDGRDWQPSKIGFVWLTREKIREIKLHKSR